MTPRLPSGFTHPMRIGEGAFATVYRARQATLDRWVAVKILHENDPARKKSLLREAKTQAQLRLACVPQIYDAFEWRNQICIAMQWIKGASLSAILKHNPPRHQRLWLADGVIAALASLHRTGYAHRDLKPANILINPEQGVYFVDFGFTKKIHDGSISQAGTVKGTPAYMEPELWRGNVEIDFMRADMFSAGRILREIIASDDFADIVSPLLSEDPQKRPASGVLFLETWKKATQSEERNPRWELCAAGLTAERLSADLYHAAQELLFAHHADEAYWLLVEAIEENPNNSDALALMGAFAHHTRRQAVRQRLLYAGAALSVIALVGIAFWAGMHSHRLPALSIALRNAGSMDLLLSPPRMAPASRSAADLPFREDPGVRGPLTGKLIIDNAPDSLTAYIDGKSAIAARFLRSGIDVPYGQHSISFVNHQNSTQWRHQISMLPFQTLVMRLGAAEAAFE